MSDNRSITFQLKAKTKDCLEILRKGSPDSPETAEKVEGELETFFLQILEPYLEAFAEEADAATTQPVYDALEYASETREQLELHGVPADLSMQLCRTAADRVGDAAIEAWENHFLKSFENDGKEDNGEIYPSNDDWEKYIERSSFCIILIRKAVDITESEESRKNIERYENLIRINEANNDSSGWSFDAYGSNVNVTKTMGRSWHKDKELSEKEKAGRYKLILEYRTRVKSYREILAIQDRQKAKKAEKQYWKEHPEEYERHKAEKAKKKASNDELAEEAEKLLENGENLQAAIMFWKAEKFGSARKAFDFRKLIGAGQSHTVGLQTDGTVLVAGDGLDAKGVNMEVCRVQKWKNIVAIDAGNFTTVGIRLSGSIVVCGSNTEGQMNTSLWREMKQICAGSRHTVGIRADGKVMATGNNQFKQCDTSKLKNVVEVSAGVYHTLLRYDDGRVSGIGAPDMGRLDTGEWKDVVMIAAGGGHSVGLRNNGTVYACGQNDRGQCNVEEWTDIVSIAAGTLHTVGVKKDGTVLTTGSNDREQCNVEEWKDIVAVAANNQTVGLKIDGSVLCAGDNAHGQNATEEWNLFRETEIDREEQLLEEKKLLKTLDEINDIKDRLRKTGVFEFKKKKELWERLKKLESELE